MPKTKTADHCYVYCAVEGHPTALPAAGMPEGGPPRALALHDDITLIVSDVPTATYNATSLEPKLSDLDWVSAAGAAHHAVVDALADSGVVVVPFRLFTIFSTTDKTVATLHDSLDAIRRAFDRVRGKQEWVLRIGKPDPARIEATAPAPPSRTSGTSFLHAKADARRESSARAQRVKEDSAAAYEALEQLADAARTRAVDPAGTLMLDAAFLVPASRVDALRETLTRMAERLLRDGCPVSLTGPWPPYSFAAISTEPHD